MMNQNLQSAVALAGRILLALIFVLSGFNKIGGFNGTAAYMTSMGLLSTCRVNGAWYYSLIAAAA